jgi:hypothetical protein
MMLDQQHCPGELTIAVQVEVPILDDERKFVPAAGQV